MEIGGQFKFSFVRTSPTSTIKAFVERNFSSPSEDYSIARTQRRLLKGGILHECFNLHH
jgi:hypothetical protein